jgi:hypothetical protein
VSPILRAVMVPVDRRHRTGRPRCLPRNAGNAVALAAPQSRQGLQDSEMKMPHMQGAACRAKSCVSTLGKRLQGALPIRW